jgi:DNA-binding transcriptional ArsR family regulator
MRILKELIYLQGGSLGGPEKSKAAITDLRSPAFLAKSLADENRLRILLCVRSGKKSVSKIVEELELSQPLVSHHLKELKRSLLVHVERKGPFVYYQISDDRVLRIIEQLSTLATDLLNKRKIF